MVLQLRKRAAALTPSPRKRCVTTSRPRRDPTFDASFHPGVPVPPPSTEENQMPEYATNLAWGGR